MIFVLIFGGMLGWVVHLAHVQRDAVAAIRSGGGQVTYDWQLNRYPMGAQFDPKGRPMAPKWLVDYLGPHYFGNVEDVGLGAANIEAVMKRIGQLDKLRRIHFFDGIDLTSHGASRPPELAKFRPIARFQQYVERSHGSGKAITIDSRRYDDARKAFATQYNFPPDSPSAYLLAARMMLRRDYLPVADTFAQKAIALYLELAHGPSAHRADPAVAVRSRPKPSRSSKKRTNSIRYTAKCMTGWATSIYGRATTPGPRPLSIAPYCSNPIPQCRTSCWGKVLLKQQVSDDGKNVPR